MTIPPSLAGSMGVGPRTNGKTIRNAGIRAFIVGFAVLFNLFLLPGKSQGASPRLTDLVGVILTAALAGRMFRGRVQVGPIAALSLVAAVPVLYGSIAVVGVFPDEPELSKTFFNGARWALSLAYGYFLHRFAADGRTRDAVLWGIMAGAAASAAVMVLQSAGYTDLAVNWGLASIDTEKSWIRDTVRPTGMQAHANGSTAMVSLVVPVACYLYWTCRARLWLPALAVVLLVATTSVSLSRGPLIATGIFLGISGFVFRNRRGTGLTFTAVAAVGLIALLAFGPPGGWDRWQDKENTDGNLAGRLETMTVSVDTLEANPLGVGSVRALSILQEATGLNASHNAFLSMALAYGIPFGCALGGVIIINITAARTNALRALYFVLSLQVSLLFFFEDLLYLPTVVCIFGWLAAGCGATLSDSRDGRLELRTRYMAALPTRAPPS